MSYCQNKTCFSVWNYTLFQEDPTTEACKIDGLPDASAAELLVAVAGHESCFLIYETESVLFFVVVLENSVLPMGWDSSHAP